jgi:endogenous inhibitor of DNA gyrase (YacG/DUF329 family)
MTQIDSIKCPICSKVGTWTPENKFKPFCSNRCKLIDLGEWASETRKIASAEPVLPDDIDLE